MNLTLHLSMVPLALNLIVNTHLQLIAFLSLGSSATSQVFLFFLEPLSHLEQHLSTLDFLIPFVYSLEYLHQRY